MNKFYLTSAIPYVNAAPHIGHAQEFLYADVVRRYHKLMGEHVMYLCGADENALKIVQAAEKAGKDPQVFCDKHQQEFLTLAKNLNIKFDIWQRGTDRQHHFPSSQKLWQLCEKNGDIYKKSYTGLYCVGCETFYTFKELDEKGECFEHPGRKLEKVSEENYFFKLSNYQKFIEDLITSDKLKIIPEIRKNEALAFVRRGLEDFSISRSRKRAKNWGVPVPSDPDQIMYVWFDGLNIYQSGIGFGWDDETYNQWKPQDVMVIGKGILRFHAIYWPAILQSAQLSIPKQLFIHGYLTVDGQKMSKTLGNVVDPNQFIEKYGTDAVRYYLLREIPSYGDGDFSERRFKELYDADLAGGLGNVISRVAALCERSKFQFPPDTNIIMKDIVKERIEEYRFHDALGIIWAAVDLINKTINDDAPWKLKGDEQKKALVKQVDRIRQITVDLQPFLPTTAEKVFDQFKGPEIKSKPPLFPRII